MRGTTACACLFSAVGQRGIIGSSAELGDRLWALLITYWSGAAMQCLLSCSF